MTRVVAMLAYYSNSSCVAGANRVPLGWRGLAGGLRWCPQDVGLFILSEKGVI